MTVRGPHEFENAFAAMATAGTDAVLALPSGMLFTHRHRLASLAAKHRLPAMFWNRPLVETGGLMSYGPHFADLARRAAHYVDRVLKGAQPADLPVEQPTKFELVINVKTARALRLTMPPALLLRADRVVECARGSL